MKKFKPGFHVIWEYRPKSGPKELEGVVVESGEMSSTIRVFSQKKQRYVEKEVQNDRLRFYCPPRVNRDTIAPDMPAEPQQLIWRECERYPGGRFVVESEHAD